MSECRFSVWDKIPLHVVKWAPCHEIRALVYMSHGVAEHMGRYQQLGQKLSENGILAEGHDHVGHGRSGGERVHVEDFTVYMKDIISHVQALKEDHPGLPCFLFGHSMGGLVAVLVTCETQELFDGIILSSAGLDVDPQSAGSLIKMAAKIIGFFAPRHGLKPVEPSFISSVAKEVEEYEMDPLIFHDPLKAKWASEMLTYIEVARMKLPSITIPVLIFHGTNDSLVPLTASEFISKNISSQDKKFEIFDGDFHEVLHDRNQERARQLITDWIISHIN